MKIVKTSFRDDGTKQNLGLGKLSISKKAKKQVKTVKVVNYNINATNCNVLAMMHYVAYCTLFAQYKQPKYRDLSTNNMRRY